MLGLLIKRTAIIENKVDDIKILNELREPIKLQRAVEITPEMYEIVKCESQWDSEAKGDFDGKEYKAHGYAQFWEETFYWLAELAGEELDYYSPNDQLFLLIRGTLPGL